MIVMPIDQDTIVAPITAQGVGAIAVVRLSGSRAITITQSIFKGKNLSDQPSHSLHVGTVYDKDKVIDEVVVALFKAPHSFTKENVAEISCHGSPIIVKEIIKVLLKQGARLATHGEFTKRAFLNGQLDLVQAEAVADLIVADTDAARQIALDQMRGGFSKKIKSLRKELINFASLIELELDFAEEKVEFAKREDLKKLINRIQSTITLLIESFDYGNVIKRGVSTVIVGKPNTGKSTLLNTLLNEERAIVSDIPGTTRDAIEDEITLDGIKLRFIDTAGIRDARGKIEAMGVRRTKDLMKKASLVIYLFDLSKTTYTEIEKELRELEALPIPVIKVGNKIDIAKKKLVEKLKGEDFIFISAQKHIHIDALLKSILSHFNSGKVKASDIIITNLRHYQNLGQAKDALVRVQNELGQETSGELVATDIRQALQELGELTGEITTDDLLNNIFSKFCIGK